MRGFQLLAGYQGSGLIDEHMRDTVATEKKSCSLEKTFTILLLNIG